MKRTFAENMPLSSENIAQMLEVYRFHLFDEVLPGWTEHSADTEYDGYITGFDRKWNITDTTKNMWAQPRHLYMYSALCVYFGQDPRWMALAQTGRDFLVKNAYAGNGRWLYRLDRTGKQVLDGPISIYSDLFVLTALSQYAVATGRDEDIPLIEQTLSAFEHNLDDRNFRDIMPVRWDYEINRHGFYMLGLNSASIAGLVLGRKRVTPLISHCLERILWHFADDEYQCLLESKTYDGKFINTNEGRIVNPGHTFESMGFCLEEAILQEDRKSVGRIIQIADWNCELGLDHEYGGIFYLLDRYHKELYFEANKFERQLAWDEKVDWVHAEALYLFALIALATNNQGYFKRFIRLHNYCQTHFVDKEYGDWYPTLNRKGNIVADNKGGKHRCAFHVPRALMKIILAMDNYVKR